MSGECSFISKEKQILSNYSVRLYVNLVNWFFLVHNFIYWYWVCIFRHFPRFLRNKYLILVLFNSRWVPVRNQWTKVSFCFVFFHPKILSLKSSWQKITYVDIMLCFFVSKPISLFVLVFQNIPTFEIV